MIQLTAQMRILVAVEPQDFRKGIDGLSRICREVLGSDPLSGKVFVFRSRRGTAMLLSYDGSPRTPKLWTTSSVTKSRCSASFLACCL